MLTSLFNKTPYYHRHFCRVRLINVVAEKHNIMVVTNRLEAGHRMGEHQVQCGVIFHQRMVLIVPNELHN